MAFNFNLNKNISKNNEVKEEPKKTETKQEIESAVDMVEEEPIVLSDDEVSEEVVEEVVIEEPVEEIKENKEEIVEEVAEDNDEIEIPKDSEEPKEDENTIKEESKDNKKENKKETKKRKTTKKNKEKNIEAKKEEDTIKGSTDIAEIHDELQDILNPTFEEWEENKSRDLAKALSLSIPVDKKPTFDEYRVLLSKIGNLLVEFRNHKNTSDEVCSSLRTLINSTSIENSIGSNAEERKHNAHMAVVNYRKTKDSNPQNLLVYLDYIQNVYNFYDTQIKNLESNKEIISLIMNKYNTKE